MHLSTKLLGLNHHLSGLRHHLAAGRLVLGSCLFPEVLHHLFGLRHQGLTFAMPSYEIVHHICGLFPTPAYSSNAKGDGPSILSTLRHEKAKLRSKSKCDSSGFWTLKWDTNDANTDAYLPLMHILKPPDEESARIVFIPVWHYGILRLCDKQFGQFCATKRCEYGICTFFVHGKFTDDLVQISCICYAPYLVERLSRGEVPPGVDSNALKLYREKGLQYPKPPSDTTTAAYSVPDIAEDECVCCFAVLSKEDGSYAWSNCNHFAGLICLRCRNAVIKGKSKFTMVGCYICRTPGMLIRYRGQCQ